MVTMPPECRDSLRSTLESMELDPALGLVWSGRPHEEPITHLKRSHNGPSTANYVLAAGLLEHWDAPFEQMLEALLGLQDTDPASPMYGNIRWHYEADGVYDGNSGFFITGPLLCADRLFGDKLADGARTKLRRLFRQALPCFERDAREPSMCYPNACLSNLMALLGLGVCLDDAGATERGRQACQRWLAYCRDQGCGWGEDHSPGYSGVLAAAAWMILHFAPDGPLAQDAHRLLDDLMDFAAFHDGVEPVPAIRSYNFTGKIRTSTALNWVLGLQPDVHGMPWFMGAFLLGGQRETRPRPAVPRRVQRRLFDGHFSTSYVEPHARLGTLSQWPVMPECNMQDTWGVGWQVFAASFVAADHDHAFLRWIATDADGTRRMHPPLEVLDFDSRCLFKRLSHHPDVLTVAHQQDGAAIVLRELHRLHAPLTEILDRWVIQNFSGRLTIDGQAWDGQPTEAVPGWLALDYPGRVTVGLYPLRSRPAGAMDVTPLNYPPHDLLAPQAPTVHVAMDEAALTFTVTLRNGPPGVTVAKYVFDGWCVVLAPSPDALAAWHVEETFVNDGEIPRPQREWVRRVTLTGPDRRLVLTRDPIRMTTVREQTPPAAQEVT